MSHQAIRLRPKVQMFSIPGGVKSYFCIQILDGKKWHLLGDDNGILKFDKEADRDSKIKELLEKFA